MYGEGGSGWSRRVCGFRHPADQCGKCLSVSEGPGKSWKRDSNGSGKQEIKRRTRTFEDYFFFFSRIICFS